MNQKYKIRLNHLKKKKKKKKEFGNFKFFIKLFPINYIKYIFLFSHYFM